MSGRPNGWSFCGDRVRSAEQRGRLGAVNDPPQIPAGARSLGADESPSRLRVVTSGLFAAIRDPVVAILLLAGLFDGLAGNLVHSILLFAVALALGRDAALRRDGPSTVADRSIGTLAATTPWPPAVLILAAVAYAAIVGAFGRYSWPATVAVVAPGAIALVITWGASRDPRPGVAPLDPVGAVAWIGAFVGLALWELAALLLQPSLTTDSYAHPTISVLTDPLLVTHPGRSITLLLWLGLGWFIMER